MFKDKHILVAGGTGFLGGAIARRLLAEGARVRATHCSRAPSHAHARLEWVRADLASEEDCARAARDVEVVVMCAAGTAGAADIGDRPMIHVTPNAVMNARLIEAAYKARAGRYLFLSSAAAYPRVVDDRPFAEADMFKAE